MNVDRDTQILIEYSRLYPLFSILSLRKIIKQFDGNKEKLNEYLSKLNQRQNELKMLKSQSKVYVPPVIPYNNQIIESNCNSPIKERKRHVSAPQHQVPRILVLPPTKSHTSCSSLSPDLPDGSFTPDSLNEGRSFRIKPRNLTDFPKIETESYEMQFYRLWKSISSEINEFNLTDSKLESEKYVLIQHEEQKSLENKVEELYNYREFLKQLNQQLLLLKHQRTNLNVLISEI